MIARYTTSFGVAVGMTFSLLLLMQVLISTGESPIDSSTRVAPPKLFPRIIDTPIEKEKPPTPPPPVVQQPAQPQTGLVDPGSLKIGPTRMPRATLGGTGIFPTLSNGDALLLVAVQPAFPPRMLSRGIEGYVILQFDVNTEGTVTNIVVLESSHRGFEAAAIKAAGKFKYKPKVVDNLPRVVTGVLKQFTFKIET